MLIDVSQDSYTLLQDASGHGTILGFSVSNAGQKPAPQSTQPHISAVTTPEVTPAPSVVRRRGRLTPRIAQSLVSTALRILDPSPTTPGLLASHREDPDVANENASQDYPADSPVASPLDFQAANQTANQLARTLNAARMALHAIHQRGQIAAWNQVLDLPEDFSAARDELEHYADTLADQLTAARHQLDPALAALNTTQTATGSWALPVPAKATRGVWAGRDHWITCAMNHCDTARTRTTRPLQCSQTTTEGDCPQFG
ncbi:hypothetical protein [Corynebacterium kalidii]